MIPRLAKAIEALEKELRLLHGDDYALAIIVKGNLIWTFQPAVVAETFHPPVEIGKVPELITGCFGANSEPTP